MKKVATFCKKIGLWGALLIVVNACNNDVLSPTTNATGVDEAKLLQLVNTLRQEGCTCGNTVMSAVPPLVWNNLLAKAAYDHSKDMNQNNYFSHTSKDGRNPAQRISAVGYNWTSYGENIAWGYPSEEAVIDGWRKSEGHCKNMMSSNFTEMGVGRSGDYWTQVFGRR
jgi:uncharacterized protein YkwD